MKLVILLGAGATLSDVASRARKGRPPLDKRFFSDALITHASRMSTVRRYMSETYDIDITRPDHDSLEGVMAQVYTDIYNPLLNESALRAFRSLVGTFNARLAATTNGIRATNKRLLYRIVTRYLWEGVAPKDLTIITFNQDIQAEKMLHPMSTTPRWSSLSETIFNFPGLYQLDVPSANVSKPLTEPEENLFPDQAELDGCIRLLKLHGSLNWYSTHSSPTPSPRAMFKPNRAIYITRRKTIAPGMPFSSTQRRLYTAPVIVPPVSHKSAVLHDDVAALWRLSEEALTQADEIVVFGYSCPALDFESSNQLRRSQRARSKQPTVKLIDPDPAVASRYVDLLLARRLHYFSSGHVFLDD